MPSLFPMLRSIRVLLGVPGGMILTSLGPDREGRARRSRIGNPSCHKHLGPLLPRPHRACIQLASAMGGQRKSASLPPAKPMPQYSHAGGMEAEPVPGHCAPHLERNRNIHVCGSRPHRRWIACKRLTIHRRLEQGRPRRTRTQGSVGIEVPVRPFLPIRSGRAACLRPLRRPVPPPPPTVGGNPSQSRYTNS